MAVTAYLPSPARATVYARISPSCCATYSRPSGPSWSEVGYLGDAPSSTAVRNEPGATAPASVSEAGSQPEPGCGRKTSCTSVGASPPGSLPPATT